MAADKAPWSECVTIFVHGKLKRVKREPTVDDIPVDDFIRCNADTILLYRTETHELYKAHE